MGNQRDRVNIEKALQKKGFKEEERDHRYYILYSGTKKTAVFTKISYGNKYKVYGKELLSKMSRQLKLSNKELLELIDCDISGDEYLKILKNRNIL